MKEMSNPFRELLDLFFEAYKKYGKVDENGYIWIDTGYSEQKCGRLVTS